MSPETRRKTLLIVLGVLLLIGAWRSLQPLLQGEKPVVAAAAVLPSGPSDDAGRSGIRPGDRLATLHLASLDRTSPGSATGGRDLWRFIDPPARHPETLPVHKALPPIQPADPQPPSPTVTAAPAPPELSLEYLGNFGPSQRKIAVFSNGKEIYNAQEGDVIDGKFIVARIGYESVDVRFVEFPEVPAQRVGVRQR